MGWAADGPADRMTSSFRHRDDLAVHRPWLPGVRGVPENDLAGYNHRALPCDAL